MSKRINRQRPNPEFSIPKIMLLPDVMLATRLARRTIEYHVIDGKFPKPFKVAGKCAWLEETILSWLSEQMGR